MSQNTSIQQLHAQQSYSSYIQNLCDTFPESSFYLKLLQHFVENTIPRQHTNNVYCLELDSTEGVISEKQVNLELHPKSPRLIVIEGFLSPEIICQLGNRYKIHPEFFLGNLEIEKSRIHQKTCYEWPTIPSRRRNLVHVTLISLGRLSFEDSETDTQSLRKRRKAANKACQDFQNEGFIYGKYGTTRLRKVHTHTPRYFSIEQRVSFCVTRNSDQYWTGVFLLDKGSEPKVNTQIGFPWNAPQSQQQLAILPCINFNNRIDPQGAREIKWQSQGTEYQIHPYHPFNDILSNFEFRLLYYDPFFALSRLYTTSALSWTQMINFLDDDISRCQDFSPESYSYSLEQLLYNTSLAEHFQSFVENDLQVIRERGSPNWRENLDPDAELEHAILKIQEDLIQDYEDLLSRFEKLLRRCQTTSDVLMNAIGIEQAQKSIDSSVVAVNLSRLAFIFVPISFATGIFGMNVKEIAGDNPPIWVFFVVCITLFIPTYLISLTTKERKDIMMAILMKKHGNENGYRE